MKFKYILIFTLIVILSFFTSKFIRDREELFFEENNASVKFKPVSHVLKERLFIGERRRLYFTFTNISESDFKINKIETRCGCTAPYWPDRKLKFNETDSILVEFYSEQKGPFVKEIYVHSNSKTSPDLLLIQGNAIVDSLESIH